MQTAGFRPDIQGLRAVAVLAVLLYHAGIPGVATGFVGVDIFFVISGFLITGLLAREQNATGTISFRGFYARRARRILPAAFVTVALTVIVALAVIPPLARTRMLTDAAATLLYIPNLLFAARQNDYLADQTPSLFQHFWSLGVEEQFYLLWPLLLLVLLRVTRTRAATVTAVVAVTALSLAFCIWLTPVDQPWAFYSLPTRAWEFGAGGMLALLTARHRLPRAAAEATGWAGIALIVASAVALPASWPFPGAAAIVPVAGTALAILAGATPGTTSARVLSIRPMQFLGLISYSVYLVHWPLLRLPQAASDPVEPGLAGSVALCGVAIGLGYLMYRFVETPWRVGRLAHLPRRTIIAGALATSLTLAGASLLGAAAVAGGPVVPPPAPTTTATASADPSSPPSADPADPVVGVPAEVVPAGLTPALAAASADLPVVYANGCHQLFHDTDPSGCLLGAATGPVVALFGDSHAAQWVPALEAAGYRIHSYTKSACPSVDAPIAHHDGTPYPECQPWRDGVIDRIGDDRPALIIIANWSGYGPAAVDPAGWGAGLRSTVDRLEAVAPVVVLDDVPQQSTTPAECLSAHLDDVAACETAPSDALASPLRETEAETLARLPDATRWSLNEWICSDTRCPLIVGGVLRYRDADHLTATFSRALASRLALLVDPVLAER